MSSKKLFFRQSKMLSLKVLCRDKKLLLKGPFGSFLFPIVKPLGYIKKEKTLVFPQTTDTRNLKFGNLFYSLLTQTSLGVTLQYRRQLNVVGIGYSVEVDEQGFLNLKLGFSHIIRIKIPRGLVVQSPKPRVILIKGVNLQKVNTFASIIRKLKVPSPYKEKGIYFLNEKFSLKQGKKT